jgi:hypothetical protein
VGSHGLKTLTTKQASAWRPLSARLQLLTDLVGNAINHAHADTDLTKCCAALLCISHCNLSSSTLISSKNTSLSAESFYPPTRTHPLSIPSCITYTLPFTTPATYGVGGTGGSLSTEGVMNFAKTTGAFTHSNAEVRDSARVRQSSLHGSNCSVCQICCWCTSDPYLSAPLCPSQPHASVCPNLYVL